MMGASFLILNIHKKTPIGFPTKNPTPEHIELITIQNSPSSSSNQLIKLGNIFPIRYVNVKPCYTNFLFYVKTTGTSGEKMRIINKKCRFFVLIRFQQATKMK
jgi:hypothetical protein